MISHLEKVYQMSDQRLEEKKNALFMDQFKRAIKQSSFYKQLYSRHGIKYTDIKSIDDIQKLPVIDKNDIKEAYNDIFIGPQLLTQKGHTSGTSGSPLTVLRDYNSILWENAYIWYFRIRHGHKVGDRAVSLRGKLLKDEMKKYDKASNTLFLSGYNINETEIDFYINEINNFAPNALIGYPSSLYALAVEFEKKEIDIQIPLGFTSSENLYDFQLKKIEKVFSMKVFDWYGNAERSIALELCEKGYYHEVPLYSHNEYHNDFLITTSFINKHFPLIRYRVDDMITPAGQTKHQCDVPSRVIEKIDGRSSDYFELKDGSIVNRMNQVFKDIEHVEYTQLVQENVEEINVNVVVSEGFSENDKKKIHDALYSRVGDKIAIKINQVTENQIIKTTAGKYRLVVNNLRK
jgi:phenylacetate-CoA ligase